MRTFTQIASDLTPSQMDAVKQEYRASRDGFVERAIGMVAGLSAEDAEVIKGELSTWPEMNRGK